MPDAPPLWFAPPLLAALPGITAGFSTRHGGTSRAPFASLNLGLHTPDDEAAVQHNLHRLCEAAGLPPDRLVIPNQVHGADVAFVSAPSVLAPACDGLVTQTPTLPLCIAAADCAVVLLADPAARVIGACHAGWRGAIAEIVPRTVAEMQRRGSRPAACYAYLSPCLSVRHFEVGPEVAAHFPEAFVQYPTPDAKPHIDLKGYLGAQLIQAGLRPEHIETSAACTYAQTADFFSYRAEQGRTGRMFGFIMLQDGLSAT